VENHGGQFKSSPVVNLNWNQVVTFIVICTLIAERIKNAITGGKNGLFAPNEVLTQSAFFSQDALTLRAPTT